MRRLVVGDEHLPGGRVCRQPGRVADARIRVKCENEAPRRVYRAHSAALDSNNHRNGKDKSHSFLEKAATNNSLSSFHRPERAKAMKRALYLSDQSNRRRGKRDGRSRTAKAGPEKKK